MAHEAGKGDALRKGANMKAYYDNYDLIFRKDKTKEKEEQAIDEVIQKDFFKQDENNND